MDLPEFAIEATGLVKTYPATKTTPEMKALRGIDLAIPRGSIFGLLGPNGAGKSTFINTLAGLTKKTSGTVKIWGRDIDTHPRDARAAIGVVPQEIAADPFFTPRESLEVQAGMYAVPRKERRTDELLAALGLADKANAYVRQLSGGMKRRLMVAKAMVHNPPVLIMDEPTAALGPHETQMVSELIQQLKADGIGIFLISHDIHDVMHLCDRASVMKNGELVGTVDVADVTDDDLLGMIILGKHPKKAA
jgi:ABC-2 type transport system ATP-binding protein